MKLFTVPYVYPKLKIFEIVNNCGQTAARFISAACIFMKKYTKEINTQYKKTEVKNS